jgi:hypothetical protein
LPRLALNLWFFASGFQVAGIIGMSHHAGLDCF